MYEEYDLKIQTSRTKKNITRKSSIREMPQDSNSACCFGFFGGGSYENNYKVRARRESSTVSKESWSASTQSPAVSNVGQLQMVQEAEAAKLFMQDSEEERKQEFKRSDFQIIREIGKGAYGKVYKAQYKQQQFALKELQKDFIIKAGKVDAVYRERDILSKIDSKNVPKLHYQFQDQHSLFFVMDLLKQGSLAHLVSCYGEEGLPEDLAKFYGAQLVLILEELHTVHKVVHRDLKPLNLMIGDDQYLRLIDFGDAQYLADSQEYAPHEETPSLEDMHAQSLIMHQDTMTDHFKGVKKSMKKLKRGTFVGTPQYVAPEMLEENTSGSFTDLWALGCILYELEVGKPPFAGKKNMTVFQNVLERNFKFPPGMDPHLQNLIDSLLNIEYYNRIGAFGRFDELKEHPYFTGIEWKKLQNHQLVVPPRSQLGEERKQSSTQETTDYSGNGLAQLEGNGTMTFKEVNQKSTIEIVKFVDNKKTPKNKYKSVTVVKQGPVSLKKFFANKERDLLLLKDGRLIFLRRNMEPEDKGALDFEIQLDASSNFRSEQDRLVVKDPEAGKIIILMDNPSEWMEAINNNLQ